MLHRALCALLILGAGAVTDVRRSLRIENAQLEAELHEAEVLADNALAATQDDYTAQMQADVVEAMEEYAGKLSDAQDTLDNLERKEETALATGDWAEADKADDDVENAAEDVAVLENRLHELILRSEQLSQMTMYERMDPLPFAQFLADTSPKEIAAAASASTSLLRTSVRHRVSTYSPVTAALLEFATLAGPGACLLSAFYAMRQGAAGPFSPRTEVILFSHLYWAIYYLLLGIMTALLHGDGPLASFADVQPKEYMVYQLCVTLLYLGHVGVLARHVTLEPSGLAGAQLAVALAVLCLSYALVTYPAEIAGLPPSAGCEFFFLVAAVSGASAWVMKKERSAAKLE